MTTAWLVTAGQVQRVHGGVLDLGGGRGQRERLPLRELPPQEASICFFRRVTVALLTRVCSFYPCFPTLSIACVGIKPSVKLWRDWLLYWHQHFLKWSNKFQSGREQDKRRFSILCPLPVQR